MSFIDIVYLIRLIFVYRFNVKSFDKALEEFNETESRLVLHLLF